MNEDQPTKEIKCTLPALFKYTWPGNDEAAACFEHSFQIKKVAEAIGLHLQMIQVDQRRELELNNEVKECDSIKEKEK